MDLREKIGDIARYEYMNFMRDPNVVGVGRGNKYINNIDTGKLCIKIYVKEKYKKGYNGTGGIPKYYFGIPTDIIETGEFIASKGFDEKIRPAKMAYSISPLPIKDEFGTAGCIVKRDNPSGNPDFFILSCNHVMANLNKLPIGTDIVQPGESMDIANVIAKLSEFEPIKFITPQSKPVNFIDAAIAKITDINLVRPQIAFMGIPKGIDPIVFSNTFIKKSGARTGYSEGIILDDSATIIIKYQQGDALFIDQIVGNLESREGDSGAMVLNRDNNIVGMIMGSANGIPSYSSINKIHWVLDEMKISLYIQK